MRHVDIVLSDVSRSQCASLAESTQEISVLWGTSTSPNYTKVLVGHESIQSLHISQQVEKETRQNRKDIDQGPDINFL